MIRHGLLLIVAGILLNSMPSFASWHPLTSPTVELRPAVAEEVEDQAEANDQAEQALLAKNCLFYPIKWWEGTIPKWPKKPEVSNFFVGQLPFKFSIESFAKIIQAIDPSIRFNFVNVGPKPTCAFIDVDAATALHLVAYSKRILCSKSGMWVAPLDNEEALADLNQAIARRYELKEAGKWEQGIPTSPIVLEIHASIQKLDKQEENEKALPVRVASLAQRSGLLGASAPLSIRVGTLGVVPAATVQSRPYVAPAPIVTTACCFNGHPLYKCVATQWTQCAVCRHFSAPKSAQQSIIYRCIQCSDQDICSKCYEEAMENSGTR